MCNVHAQTSTHPIFHYGGDCPCGAAGVPPVCVALFHSIYTSFMPVIQISPSSAESMDVAKLPRVFLLSISTFYKKHRDAGIIQSRVSNNSLTAGTVVIPVESTI